MEGRINGRHHVGIRCLVVKYNVHEQDVIENLLNCTAQCCGWDGLERCSALPLIYFEFTMLNKCTPIANEIKCSALLPIHPSRRESIFAMKITEK